MSLSAFLRKNAVPVENVRYAASRRFLTGAPETDGQPVEWELRAVSGAEDEELRRSCMRQTPVPGRRNQYRQETDYDLYLGRLAVACTVFPDLNDKSLQDDYRVMGADALLKAMLTPGEYAAYLEKVQQLCGFDATLQEEVDEAKN